MNILFEVVPTVAVYCLLVSYNKSYATIDCVKSLQKSKGVDLHICVVDNNSEYSEYQNLLEMEDERTEIIRLEENTGYVGGMNHALKIMSGKEYDYILILNNDTVIDADAIMFLTQTAKDNSDRCIVSGKVYNIDEPQTLQYIGQWCRNHEKLDYPPYIKNGNELDTGQYDKIIEMDMLDDIYWLLPKQVYEAVGLYDTRFYMYGEQNDFALRAKKMGFKLVYSHNARLWHYHHLSSTDAEKGYPSVTYWKAYSGMLLAYLHTKRSSFISFYGYRVIKGLFEATKGAIVSRSSFKTPNLMAYYYFTRSILLKEKNSNLNPFRS